MVISRQRTVKPQRPGHPPPEPWRIRRRLLILSIILLTVIAAALLTMLWQMQNQSNAAKITGSWYCEEEGIQYRFQSDGTFSSTNGQQTLLSGTWQAGRLKKTLVLAYQVENETRKLETDYTLNKDQTQLKLLAVNGRILNMKRLQDS